MADCKSVYRGSNPLRGSMRLKLELTLKHGNMIKDIAIAPRFIDSDEPMDGLTRLYEDLIHYTDRGHQLHIVASEVKDGERS